jgi:hypothetical protein
MYAGSFDKKGLNITIRNQHPDLELAFPVYCSNGTTCHVSPSQQAGTGTTIEARFGKDSEQKTFEGVLLYKIQRRYATRTDGQPNSDIASTKDTITNTYLLLGWNVRNSDRKFYVCLVEIPHGFIRNEDMLWALHKTCNYQLYVNYKSNKITLAIITLATKCSESLTNMWLMQGGTLMKIGANMAYGSDYKLDITLSKGTGCYNMKMPMKVDPKRLVLSLLMLLVLMYAVRLRTRPPFNLNIYNRCWNTDLISPTYITDHESECYKAPDYKVCTGNVMRFGFTICESENLHNGAFICRLQRRRSHKSAEISKDKLGAVCFLVVWRTSVTKGFCADILLVKYNGRFDKNILRKLYIMNINQFKLCSNSATKTWSLDDNTALMTSLEIMNEGHILNITTSKVNKHDCTRMPAHIDIRK